MDLTGARHGLCNGSGCVLCGHSGLDVHIVRSTINLRCLDPIGEFYEEETSPSSDEGHIRGRLQEESPGPS